MESLTVKNTHFSRTKEKGVRKSFLSRNLWQIALGLSFPMAILLACSGFFLSSLSYCNLFRRPELTNEIGVFLILFAALLFFFAAHCLDQIFKREKRYR